jgi:hypothetical protein
LSKHEQNEPQVERDAGDRIEDDGYDGFMRDCSGYKRQNPGHELDDFVYEELLLEPGHHNRGVGWHVAEPDN